MTRIAILKAMRAILVAFVSLILGFAITRFILSNSGMMPLWMQVSIRAVLAVFGWSDPGPEDIVDVSILGTLLTGLILAALATRAFSGLTRRFTQSAFLNVALTVISFYGAYVMSSWIEDTLISPAPRSLEPDDFEILYLSGLLLACWFALFAAALVLLLAIFRIHAFVRRNSENS
ncbi:hypothetical protein NK8_29480 [Caballeronia sp. NK8]|nr:hypothetical protein NK8_29480 [Caballeronia sp. NK8]